MKYGCLRSDGLPRFSSGLFFLRFKFCFLTDVLLTLSVTLCVLLILLGVNEPCFYELENAASRRIEIEGAFYLYFSIDASPIFCFGLAALERLGLGFVSRFNEDMFKI